MHVICIIHVPNYNIHTTIENRCILILWVIWRPALGSGSSRTPGASLSVWKYRFRLLGNGFKIKSVTPYFSQSEKGTQPRGGGKFSTIPMEGDGGDNERGEKEEVPRLKGKEFRFFPFLHRGGLQSVRLGTGGWFRLLPRGTRQAGKKGK